MAVEIPTVPVGSIKTEQDGDNLFLLLHGVRIAKRGRAGTRKLKMDSDCVVDSKHD